MNELNEICSSFSTLNENNFIDLILYGSDKSDDKKNRNILMCTIKFIKGSQRFDENLLYFFWYQCEANACIIYVYILGSFNVF